MIADCEDLQESKAPDIYVKNFKSQDVFVKNVNANFRVQTELLDFLILQDCHYEQRETLEPEDDVEVEDADKKKRKSQGVEHLFIDS